jgi:hypothetical protein
MRFYAVLGVLQDFFLSLVFFFAPLNGEGIVGHGKKAKSRQVTRPKSAWRADA